MKNIFSRRSRVSTIDLSVGNINKNPLRDFSISSKNWLLYTLWLTLPKINYCNYYGAHILNNVLNSFFIFHRHILTMLKRAMGSMQITCTYINQLTQLLIFSLTGVHLGERLVDIQSVQ